jgi:hypothetical protein
MRAKATVTVNARPRNGPVVDARLIALTANSVESSSASLSGSMGK